METYKIVRIFRDSARKQTVKTGLTLEEAQSHCQDSETISYTAKSVRARARTKKYGEWFDAFYKE